MFSVLFRFPSFYISMLLPVLYRSLSAFLFIDVPDEAEPTPAAAAAPQLSFNMVFAAGPANAAASSNKRRM